MELRHVRTAGGDRTLIDRWLEICQPDERTRYDRLLVAAARERFARSRLVVRLVFAEMLDALPADVRLDSRPSGRPTAEGIPFASWSRSAEHVLIGMGADSDGDLGVDIEARASAPALTDELWDLIASPREVGLRTEPDAILRLWTLKESAVKALGVGLQLDVRSLLPLDRFPDPGEPLELLDGWASQVVDVGDGAFAAITSQRPERPRLRTDDLVELAGALR